MSEHVHNHEHVHGDCHDECCCHDHEHHHEHSHDYHHDHDHDHGGCGCAHCEANRQFDLHTGRTAEHEGFLHEHRGDIVRLIIGAAVIIASLIMEHVMDVPMIYYTVLPLCIIAYLLLGKDVLLESFENIKHGEIFDENFLMAVATIAAFCIGDFPEAVAVILFYCIGEMFEDISVERSREQIVAAVDMRPETVRITGSEEDWEGSEIPAGDAKIGDLIIVKPGDRIPLDGTIVKGECQIDTSPVTGEPVPVVAKAGADIFSGCINIRGQAIIKVSEPLETSMVSRILDSVENAAASKPQIDKFITKFAKIYTPIVCALALIVAILPPLILGGTAVVWKHWILTAVTFLVISCPCAMIISVPLAYFLGIGAASRKGILFKSGLALEALRKVKIAAMDKTGTITTGIVEDKGLLEVETTGESETFDEAFAKKTVSDDKPKEDAASGIALLKKIGVLVAMLTGDKRERAYEIGRQVGIDEKYIACELLPENKLTALNKLREENGEILFVGDGINDAPVLAGADVGAAMGAGADAAIEAADIVYMNSNVEAIPQSIQLARKTGTIAVQDIVIALVIKLIILAIGLLGFANIWLAIFADTGVMIICILNTLRLLRI